MKNLKLTLLVIALAAMVLPMRMQAQTLCSAAFQYTVGTPTPNGTTVSFYDSSFAVGTITSWSWTFSTGQVSTQQNPVIQVINSNSIYACLTITSMYQGTACTSTWCDSIYVNVPPPTCNSTFTYVVNPLGVTFAAATGGNVQWTWDFGDGSTGTGANPTHAYSAPGTYTVCLTVLTANGTICTTCTPVTVGGTSGCQAFFTWAPIGGTTLTAFTNQSTGNPTVFYWNFGDGTTSTLANPTHTFTGTGPYYVCLTISDSLQTCTDTYCDSVYVNSTGQCNASFTASSSPSGLVSFTNTSTPPNATYYWDFGDGTSSTLFGPSHMYANPGVYTVCLTVTSGFFGCTDTYCSSVVVSGGGGCSASFTWVPDSTGYGIQFTNTSTGNPTNYSWTFSNGTTSSLQNPFVVFNSAGWYNVCLTIWVVNGTCQSTFCDSIYVGGSVFTCSSNFAIYPDTNVAHNYFAINLASGVGPISYVWSWGDGTSSTGPYPSHTYAGPGLYTICLTITDATGCTSTTCYQWQLLRLSSSVPVTINVVPGATGIPYDKFVSSFSTYPNPATDVIYAEFSLERTSDVVVKFFNMAGQIALEVAATPYGPGNHELKLDASSLPKGMYLIQVEAAGSVAKSKVLIQ